MGRFGHREAEVPAAEEDAQVHVAVQHQAHALEGRDLVEAADLLVHRALVAGQHHDGAELWHRLHQILPRTLQAAHAVARSEERRGGKDGVSTCTYRWSPDLSKKKLN